MITIIVPCYNEAEVLPLFMEEIKKLREKLKRDLHILFVDDGSKDKTLELLRSYCQDPNFSYISFSRNFGKEAAIYAGLKNARGEYIGLMDADLQHDPALIPLMEEYLDQGYDVCAARRRSRIGSSGLYELGAKAFYGLINKMGDNVNLEPGVQDFRLMKRPVVDGIISLGEASRFSKGIFSWVGFKIKYIETEDRERKAGVSKWPLRKSIAYGIDGILSFTVSPLRLATYTGLTVSFIGFIYAIYVLIKTLTFGVETQGFATIVILILILGGLNLVFLGLIGEYIGRIYKETKARPIYLVREEELHDRQ